MRRSDHRLSAAGIRVVPIAGKSLAPSALWRGLKFGSLIVVALFLLSACSSLRTIRSDLQQDSGSAFSANELTAYVANQESVRAALATMASAQAPSIAGITRPVVAPLTEWDGLIDAGMNYADSKCRRYLDALHRLDRNRRTAVTEIGLVGTAVAGLMAAAKSTAKEVAIVAILFGLSSASVDNLAGNVLYELPPSTVASMVKDQQLQFRISLQRGYPNWPSALSVIQSYAILCVPSHIEEEINSAIKKTKAGTEIGNPATGQPPAVSNELRAVQSGDFKMDAIGQLLLGFVSPGGLENKANRDRLQSYLDAHEGGIPAGSLIVIGANAQARVRAAKAMNLIP